MYTMKIIFLEFLLICAIAEVFAKWSPLYINIPAVMTLRSKQTPEEEAKQDILNILKTTNVTGLNKFPLEGILSGVSLDDKIDPKKKSELKEKANTAQNDIKTKSIKRINKKEKYPYAEPLPPDLTKNVVPNKRQKKGNIPTKIQSYYNKPANRIKLEFRPPKNAFSEYNDNSFERNAVLDLKGNDNLATEVGQLQARYPKQYVDPKKDKKSQMVWKNITNEMDPNKGYRVHKVGDLRNSNTGNNPSLHNAARSRDVEYIPVKQKLKNNLYNFKTKLLVYRIVNNFMDNMVNFSIQDIQTNHKFFKHRSKRQIQAGYTQDPETCKKYNENLGKMWSTLSKYLNYTDSVNEIALHNIAVMVEAYLDHKTKYDHNQPVEVNREKKRDKISEYLRKIKKILGTDDATDKVKNIILENFIPPYEEEESDCKQINEDNLVSSIAISYNNYLDNAKCHGDYDTGLLRGKALLRTGSPTKASIKVTSNVHDLDYNPHKSILNEDESSENFRNGKMPMVNRSKQRRQSHRRIQKRSYDRYENNPNQRRRSVNTRSGMRRKSKNIARKKSRGRKRTHMRTDNSCVKYANRKFLITLRTSIERFMALRDCQHDDTLRTSHREAEYTDEEQMDAESDLKSENKDTTPNPEYTDMVPKPEYSNISPDTEYADINSKPEYGNINRNSEYTDTNPTPEAMKNILNPEYNNTHPNATNTKIKLSVLRIPNERYFNTGNLYSDTELGRRDQGRVKNYLSQVKEFEGQDPMKNRSLFVVHSASTYKNPVLLKIKRNQLSDQKPTFEEIPLHSHNIHNYESSFQPQHNNTDTVHNTVLDHSNVHPTENQYTNWHEVIKESVGNHNNITTTRTDNITIHNVSLISNGSLRENAFNASLEKDTLHAMNIDFGAIGDILSKVRNTSLHTPQIDAVNFAADSKNGYVELSYLVKYPKTILYRPQYLVKNILQYEDFVKVANQLYVSNDDKQLLKIVRFLPNNTAQTLFETRDITTPLEIHDVKRNGAEEINKPLLVENTSNTPIKVSQLRTKVTNETDFDDGNQTEVEDDSDDMTRQGSRKEDSSDMDLNITTSDYISYQNDSYNDFKPNMTNVDVKEPRRMTNVSDFGLESILNLTAHKIDDGDDVDQRILEIFNTTVNSGELIDTNADLEALDKNVTSYNIDDESIDDYLRFRLDQAEANLSTASHAYLKELEAQGISSSTVTKSMLRTWWQAWKNKLNSKSERLLNKSSRKFDQNEPEPELNVLPTKYPQPREIGP